jgi:hypothetical protein
MTGPATRVLVEAKRAYGTGRILVKNGAYYGSWRTTDGRRTTRKLGPIRKDREGLTKTNAEAKLRELMLADNGGKFAHAGTVPSVTEAGIALVGRLRRDKKKLSHIESVESHLRAHINPPLLGDMLVTDVPEADVDRLVSRMLREGLAAKTVRNVILTMHSLMERRAKDKLIATTPSTWANCPGRGSAAAV